MCIKCYLQRTLQKEYIITMVRYGLVVLLSFCIFQILQGRVLKNQKLSEYPMSSLNIKNMEWEKKTQFEKAEVIDLLLAEAERLSEQHEHALKLLEKMVTLVRTLMNTTSKLDNKHLSDTEKSEVTL